MIALLFRPNGGGDGTTRWHGGCSRQIDRRPYGGKLPAPQVEIYSRMARRRHWTTVVLRTITRSPGVKKIGGVHDNFGVGAKIASLPWNPEGVVVISYVEGKGSLIHIALNRDTNEYEVAVAKIAHSEKLSICGISEEELTGKFRTDEALTLGLMGLLAEESLIAQRLGKLGRKKAAA